MSKKVLFTVASSVCLIALIGTSLVIGCAAKEEAAPAPTPAPAAEVIKWKWQSPWSSSYIGNSYFVNFCDHVEEVSQGQFIIDLYEAGALMSNPEILYAIGDNTIQMTFMYSNMWAGEDESFSLINGWPFGPTWQQLSIWYREGPGKEMAQELYTPYNIKWFPCYVDSTELGPWSKFPVNTIDDMVGKTWRMPAGLIGEILEKLDITSVPLQGGEIYSALERGVVDGAEFGRPGDDYLLGLHEVAKYVSVPGWFQPVAGFDVEVNMDSWNSLPPHLQTLFEMAVNEMTAEGTFGLQGMHVGYLNDIFEAGVEAVRLPDEDLDMLRVLTYEVMSEKADANPQFKKIWESQMEWIEKLQNYDDFIDFRRGVTP